MSYKSKMITVEIEHIGIWTIVRGSCSIILLWNSKSSLIIEIPPTYGDHVTGLCGNCNGRPDDSIAADGSDVSRYPHGIRSKLLAESYAVYLGKVFPPT